jgi:hypothetical protein
MSPVVVAKSLAFGEEPKPHPQCFGGLSRMGRRLASPSLSEVVVVQ